MKFQVNSKIMSFFLSLKIDSFAWSFRRLYCPVDKKSLVLEVGSGGNPYFRSNILLDAYFETRERHWEPLISDRPTVLGFVENLPFKDKSFDFVIASHVLEHTPDPVKFLSELQRVAKAGYIEVPDAFMERINPYLDHRIEVTIRNNKLIIRKKSKSEVDPELVELYRDKVSRVITSDTMSRYPFHFHVRYYWNDKIDYEILNSEVDANWPTPIQLIKTPKPTFRAKINTVILKLVRKVFSQNNRNKSINVNELLICPSCKISELVFTDKIVCNSCKMEYSIMNGIPNLTISN